MDTADLMLELLSATGHVVVAAHTGRDGIAAAQQLRAEIVLCDVGLPDIDGYAVARALRAEPITAGARLIALTGYGGSEQRDRALGAGFDMHIVKPVNPDALLRLISDVET